MLKQTFDIVCALIGIVVLSPVLLTVALLVYINLSRPIIFKQKRPGLYGKPYYIYKFRTMTNERDEDGKLLPTEKRLTPFGNKLRSTSLDELPELLNVLKGEMSLVGPRPLRMEYLPLYSKEQARRHEVKPGITGWAQVNGRNKVSWKKRFEMDVWYVDNQSLWLDLKIIFKTLGIVVIREGVLPEDELVMSRFEGNEERSNSKSITANEESKKQSTDSARV